MIKRTLLSTLLSVALLSASLANIQMVSMDLGTIHGLRGIFMKEAEKAVNHLSSAVDKRSLKRIMKWTIVSQASLKNLYSFCAMGEPIFVSFDPARVRAQEIEMKMNKAITRARPLFADEFRRSTRRLVHYTRSAICFISLVNSSELACARSLSAGDPDEARLVLIKSHFVARFVFELSTKMADETAISHALMLDTAALFESANSEDVDRKMREDLFFAIGGLQVQELLLKRRISSLTQLTALLEKRTLTQ